MTTGSVVSGGDPLSQTFVGVGFRKTWSGEDGKYETYQGYKRQKWNNFTLEASSRMRPVNYWNLVHRYHGPGGGAIPDSPALYTSLAADWDNGRLFESNEIIKLQGKLLRKVKDHQFNLAVNLAQMDQLSGMVASNLLKFGRAFRALKHGDFATAARTLGARPKTSQLKATDVSGRWLELQYGWLPAVSDMYEAAKAFHAISEGPRKAVVRVSARKETEFNASLSANYQGKGKNQLTRYIQYEMSEEMSVPRQLGLADPLSLVWELLPYSFVVDWAIPIGSYLELLNQIPNLKGRFLTTTVRKRWGVYDIKYTAPSFGPLWTTEVVPPAPITDTARYTKVDRVFQYALDTPMPSFNQGGGVHGKRIFNAIALAHLAFESKTIFRRQSALPSRPGRRVLFY